jgi:GT2 family glycosyltransferase
MNKKVSIIILNWNGWEDTIECLESVFQNLYPSFEVIVVDNGSKDDSIRKINDYAKGQIKLKSNFFDYVQENKPIYIKEYSEDELEILDLMKESSEKSISSKNLIIIKNERNYGFAEGNNIGIRFALNKLNPDYILLLNNDAIVNPNFLNDLINVAEKDKHIGILGPTVYDYRNPNEIQSAGTKIYWSKGEIINLTPLEKKLPNEPEEVDSVIGCALLARSELFHKIGYLNKDYFAYLEETEWCVRVHRAGYKIVYVPEGKIWHKGGATSNKITGFTLYHYTRNKFWFMKKHSSKKQFLFFLIYFFGFRMWFVFGGIFCRHKETKFIQSLNSFLKGIRDGLMT